MERWAFRMLLVASGVFLLCTVLVLSPVAVFVATGHFPVWGVSGVLPRVISGAVMVGLFLLLIGVALV